MWNIILVVVWIWFCIPVITRFMNAVKGTNQIKMLHQLGHEAVKLVDFQHKKEDYVKSFVLLGGTLGLAIYCIYLNGTKIHSISWGIVFVIAFIHQIVALMWLLVVKKYGKYAYFTKASLVSVDGVFTKSDCRFCVEGDLREKEKMYLNVFQGKKEQLYRFEVVEQQEKVLQIIENYYTVSNQKGGL